MLKAAFITLSILLLTAAGASADPISGAIAAFSAFLSSGGIVAGIVKIAIVAAANFGMSLIQQAQARRQARKNQRPSGVTLSVQMGDAVPRSYLIGTRATAGRRVYIGTWGEVDKTPNAYLTDVIELSCLPNHAGPQGLDRVWIGDKEVTILWNLPAADGRGYPVQEYRVGGTDFLWIKFLDGSQTVADPFLVAKFGTLAERPFKSTMIARGCQAVILTARINQDLFKSGLPQGIYQPKPMRLYDLRKDSTNGGTGTHRWSDPSTWEASDNLPLQIYNVSRGIYYDGRWLHGGRNFAQHRLPASSWIAALNEADRLLSGRKQYRGGLEVFVDQDPLEVIEDLRIGCAARLAEVGGILKILVGAPAAAVYSFTDAQIVVTSDQDFEPFPTVSATHNTITAVYPEPEQRWADKDAPEKSSATLLARDDGERLPVATRFDAVSIVDQVQCLMSTMIEEEQRWRTHELVLPPDASALEPNDVVSWSSDRNAYSNKKFLVVRAISLSGLLQRLLLKEIDPADYDPPEILLPPVVGPTGPIAPPAQPLYGWQAVPATIYDTDGNARRPSIKVICAPDQDDVAKVWVQVRLKSTAAGVFDSDSTPYADPYEWVLNGTFLPATLYQARGKFVPYSRRETEWSDWIDVMTPNVRLTSGLDFDPYDGTIGFDNLADDLKDYQDWLGSGRREILEKLEEISLIVADQDLGNAVERQKLREQLTATRDKITAEYTREVQVLVAADTALASSITSLTTSFSGFQSSVTQSLASLSSADQALALSVEELEASVFDPATGLPSVASAVSALQVQVNGQGDDIEAMADQIASLETQVGDVSSSVNVRATAVAGGSGGFSRWAVQVKTSTSDWSAQAGLYVETHATLPSRILLDAQQLFFGDLSSGAAPINPLVYSGGRWRSEAQDIGTVYAGTINFGNGRVIIDENGIVVTS
ncbi:phage tail protein [Rhizobium sp. YS-1r]|uniref:phage tail protein n=1 Tax=Rhizobium sp. YS-1r TaxID=1532558 RepID=UPI00068C48C0|nr:phage tail protein [Rhizobium sp. YS-1r]